MLWCMNDINPGIFEKSRGPWIIGCHHTGILHNPLHIPFATTSLVHKMTVRKTWKLWKKKKLPAFSDWYMNSLSFLFLYRYNFQSIRMNESFVCAIFSLFSISIFSLKLLNWHFFEQGRSYRISGIFFFMRNFLKRKKWHTRECVC